MSFKFFTYGRHCSVDTELIGKNNYAKNSLNCWIISSKMYRQFSVSFAFELTPGQWSRCTENRTSALCEFQQHLVRDVIPIPCGPFSSVEYHFFSEPGPINDHCPTPNLLASTLTTPAFAKHSSLLPFLSQEMSLNIDTNRILPVKVSGVCP